MLDRKEEIEKRRKKVEELKRQRLELASNKSTTENNINGPLTSCRAFLHEEREKERQHVEELLTSLLGASEVSETSKTCESSKNEEHLVQLTSQAEKICISETTIHLFPSNCPISYQKGCQTNPGLFDQYVDELVQEKLEIIQMIEHKDSPEAPNLMGSSENREMESEEEKESDLPLAVKEQILRSDEYSDFLNYSTRLVERYLNWSPEYDFVKDYSGAEEFTASTIEILNFRSLYYSAKWTTRRPSTDLDWCRKFPELFLSSYGAKYPAEDTEDPQGACLVWNVHLKDRPEYVFHCQVSLLLLVRLPYLWNFFKSPVLSSKFAKFHPSLVVGSTYSGQLVLWDKRSKATPVQRSPPSSKSHTHPVFCLEVVGSPNAHNIVSCSTDGLMCSWTFDALHEPLVSTKLQGTIRGLAVTAMSFSGKDVNNFVVGIPARHDKQCRTNPLMRPAGTEEGRLYCGNRHAGQQVKEPCSPSMDGHCGPVTHHPELGEADFPNYLLSSSTDWSVKLWNLQHKKIIHSFEDADDYVYDVQWSPTHPGAFATADGPSRLSLWDMNRDIESPVLSTIVSETSSINKLRWSASGRHMTVGDADGTVYLYEVGEEYTSPAAESFSRFKEVIRELDGTT
ncbi:cytoplasmic dynein 1 intermediate chain 2-like isoform X3 [Zophobas morio]|uniref:cytoplasmic dynein 1 intermediate chain 2-like isoform X3 n=1 Tax=Zophobas morio TaxID=2755281 RepID=UPI003082ADF7